MEILERLNAAPNVEKAQQDAFFKFIKGHKGKFLSVSTGDGIWDYMVLKNDKKNQINMVATDIVDCPVTANDIELIKRYGSWEFKKVEAEKNMPFKDNRFDVIYHHDVIEHVQCPFQFLSDQYRLLKKGGILAFSTPNLLRLPNLVRLGLGKLEFPRYMMNSDSLGQLIHTQEFTEWNIRSYLQEVGFKNIEFTPTFSGLVKYSPFTKQFPTSKWGVRTCHILSFKAEK